VLFLLAVTVAVLLIRAGLRGGSAPTTTSHREATGPAATTSSRSRTDTRRRASPPRYYIVQSGDTYGSIATKTGTSVARLEQLNPGVASNALHVGQRIRVK
jgi:LysM repeat protein